MVLWKSAGFLSESIVTPSTTNNSLSPSIKLNRNLKFYLVYKVICLKQSKTTFTHQNTIIFIIVYELDARSQDLNVDLTLKSDSHLP